jgi:hypothetical protein
LKSLTEIFVARGQQTRYFLNMQIERLTEIGMEETFNPADAPDETAWREAMEQAPKGWNEIEAGLDEATR